MTILSRLRFEMRKISLALYAAATATIVIPIFYVLITDMTFNSFYSNLIISSALLLVIEGKMIEIVRKAKVEGVVSWSGLGAINGLLILLLWRAVI
jgi:hypothetical protein